MHWCVVLPVKRKVIYIWETPTWMDVVMNFMGVVRSKKRKQRLIILKDGVEQ
jgi:hypothetical protein